MSANPIFDAMDDELTRALEQGANLPETFTITLGEDEFQALLGSGLHREGKSLPVGTSEVSLRLATHRVTIRRETPLDKTENL